MKYIEVLREANCRDLLVLTQCQIGATLHVSFSDSEFQIRFCVFADSTIEWQSAPLLQHHSKSTSSSKISTVSASPYSIAKSAYARESSIEHCSYLLRMLI